MAGGNVRWALTGYKAVPLRACPKRVAVTPTNSVCFTRADGEVLASLIKGVPRLVLSRTHCSAEARTRDIAEFNL